MPWETPYTAHTFSTNSAVPTLSVAELILGLHRSPASSAPQAGKGTAEPPHFSDPPIADLKLTINNLPGTSRAASRFTGTPQIQAAAVQLPQPSPAGESPQADQHLGKSLGIAALQSQDPQQPEQFSEDNELREAAVVDGSNQTSTVALMDLGWTFQLHSSPTSSKVIYLDFDGHTTTGTSWNNATMGASFYSPAYDIDGNPAVFSNEELSRIQQIWQRVAADYAPFDVDVTTQAPPTDWLIKSSSTDPNYGMRAVITSYGPSSSTAGGIASVNSFTASTDRPCFIYNKSLTGVAEAISHEVGHTLGLSHDGTSSSSYYYGHGSGETSWAPIMGVGYNKNVTQWDNGTYYGTNNGSATANYGRGPNDMAVISTYNGFGYQLDQVGNAPSSAASLTISGGVVSQFGRIETALDNDFYSFQLQSSGDVNLKFDPYCYRAFVDRDGAWGGSNLEYTAPVSDGNSSTPYADSGTNLDLSVGLYSSTGSLLGSFDGAGLATTLAWSNLAAGTYFLKLDGVGTGSPTSSSPSGYSDYGSVGNYLITGTITNALDSAALAGTPTALAPIAATPTRSGGSGPIAKIVSPSGTTAAAAPAPTDPLTGGAAGAVPSLALGYDALLAPRPSALAPGSPDLAIGTAAAGGLQAGPIQALALVPHLGVLGAPSRSTFPADLQAGLRPLGLGGQQLTTQPPAWALA